MKRVLLFFALIFFHLPGSHAQSKAYVLQSLWSSSFNPYDPAPFYDEVFLLLQNRLKVNEIYRNPLLTKLNSTQDDYKEIIRTHVKESSKPAYYIAVISDLSLPLFNFTRIFKAPTRTTKLVFAINLYNNKGEKMRGDTIISKGCIVKAINETKIKEFYDSYAEFRQDMQCHLAAIRKELEGR